jgi:hypothetical protein
MPRRAALKDSKASSPRNQSVDELDSILADGRQTRRRIQYYDPFGRESGTYIEGDDNAMKDRDFSAEAREKAANSGAAESDGSFPIKSVGDLKNAIRAVGRSKDREKTMRHIKSRARSLGRTDLIPEGWGARRRMSPGDAWSEEAREAARASRGRAGNPKAAGERQKREREKNHPGWGRAHVAAYGHTSKWGSHGDSDMPVFITRAEKRDVWRKAMDGGPGSGPQGGGKKSVRERFENPEYKEHHNPEFQEPKLGLKGGTDNRWATGLRSRAGMKRDARRRAANDALFLPPPPTTPAPFVVGIAPEPTPTPTLLFDAEPHFMMFDNLTMDEGSKVRISPDTGYLSAQPRVARVGIQVYSGDECGKPEMAKVRVYRPHSTVFNADSMRGFAHKPVTLNHPDVRVTSDTWKAVSIGHTGDEVLRDGEAIRVPMVLMDAKAIKAYKDGHRQLSMGYTCDLEWMPGTTKDGEAYDAVQINVHPNHLAVVPAARGGPTLCIGDNSSTQENKDMNATTPILKPFMVDGIQCEMTDVSASIVNRAIAGYQQQLDAWKKKNQERDDDDEEEEKANDAALKAKDATVATKDVKIAELETAMKTKDAEIVTVKAQLKDAQLSPQQIDALVKDRQLVIDKGRKLLGDRFVVDSAKTIEDMRAAVVQAKLGDACKGWDANQIKASFDTLTAGLQGGTGGTVTDAVAAFAGRPGAGYQTYDAGQALKDAAYEEMVRDNENAWKPKEVQDAERDLRAAQRRAGN